MSSLCSTDPAGNSGVGVGAGVGVGGGPDMAQAHIRRTTAAEIQLGHFFIELPPTFRLKKYDLISEASSRRDGSLALGDGTVNCNPSVDFQIVDANLNP